MSVQEEEGEMVIGGKGEGGSGSGYGGGGFGGGGGGYGGGDGGYGGGGGGYGGGSGSGFGGGGSGGGDGGYGGSGGDGYGGGGGGFGDGGGGFGGVGHGGEDGSGDGKNNTGAALPLFNPADKVKVLAVITVVGCGVVILWKVGQKLGTLCRYIKRKMCGGARPKGPTPAKRALEDSPARPALKGSPTRLAIKAAPKPKLSFWDKQVAELLASKGEHMEMPEGPDVLIGDGAWGVAPDGRLNSH